MRGRKRSDKTRDYILHIRMNKKEMDILAYVCSKKGKDASKVIRELVKEEYDKLEHKGDCKHEYKQ